MPTAPSSSPQSDDDGVSVGGPLSVDDRTTLSWERTAMALVVVAAGTARHTWSELGAAALVPLVPMMLLSFWVLAEGWRRYDDDLYFRVYRAIGGPTFLLAATTALTAAVEASHLFT
ncbi:DUF202 domain-containing protein [Nocardioides sp. zg-DK7169]|uniref:DUF202 domain-containing protein n=1 Tax=Nocardioides sp. zg-DK7169 TaxID=2736600 RepID=UPI001557D3FE|nr:DUF202 domain-containing protein [Nocardioides sp. zg-DK7169]NPC98930.1 DUF202 domain-containing protein [Nocardioides sp. zg-DK7169]